MIVRIKCSNFKCHICLVPKIKIFIVWTWATGIHELDVGFFIFRPGLTFATLWALVNHYSRDADGLCVNLRKPCVQIETSAVHQVEPYADPNIVMRRLRRGRNAWQQLGLEPGCSIEEVYRQYRKLAILLHPDKTNVRGAEEALKQLGMARNTILNSLDCNSFQYTYAGQ